jgi:hypothetical protein
VGHGVAADWELLDGACRRICTAWIPSAEVEKTVTVDVPVVELHMDALGAIADGAAAEAALRPLAVAYRVWLGEQLAAATRLQGARRETAETLVSHAEIAAGRIERGIALLTQSPQALDAFRAANRAVARALAVRDAVRAIPASVSAAWTKPDRLIECRRGCHICKLYEWIATKT